MDKSGYIAFDDSKVIWGIGRTIEEALQDARYIFSAMGERVSDLYMMPATRDFLLCVESDGGTLPWTEVDGVAVLDQAAWQAMLDSDA